MIHASGFPDFRVRRSPFAAHLPLVGVARDAPTDAQAMLVFDFGQTSVKCAVAAYESAVLTELHLLPSTAAPCTDLNLNKDPILAQKTLDQMLGIISMTWQQVADSYPLTQQVSMSLACYLLDGHPIKDYDWGCYGRLQTLTNHMQTLFTAQVAARLQIPIKVRLHHDGAAAAMVYAGGGKTAVSPPHHLTTSQQTGNAGALITVINNGRKMKRQEWSELPGTGCFPAFSQIDRHSLLIVRMQYNLCSDKQTDSNQNKRHIKDHHHMPTTLNLTPEQIANYRAHAQKRRRQEQPEVEQRRQQAWEAARKAAQLLRQQFHATRVAVFGSLARETGFTRWSDVDIAAWGLAPEDTFRAIGAIMDMDTKVPVNLVDINTARPALLAAIDREAITL